MSADQTARLGLPYLAAAQAQKHVTVNEALTLLDGLLQTAVESRSVAAEPTGVADGALYILPAAVTGADWSGQAAGALMRYEGGAWVAVPTTPGLMALVKDEGRIVVRTASGWSDLTQLLGAPANLPGLGINATPDNYNALVVKSQAALFDNTGYGTQVKLNKASAGDTASILFQTNYATLMEVGLVGDNHVHIKGKPGANYGDLLFVNTDTGCMAIGGTSTSARLAVNGSVKVAATQISRLGAAILEGAGSIAFVLDDVGGPTLAVSDGSVWRRVYDRAPLQRG